MAKSLKKFKHLEPVEAKNLEGTMRKEVLLSAPIIKLLKCKAVKENTDLKKYLEKCLIKIASLNEFSTDINL